MEEELQQITTRGLSSHSFSKATLGDA